MPCHGADCRRRDDFAVSQRWLRRAENSAKLRGSPREAALNQIVRGEILARQGQADAACRTLTEAAARAARDGHALARVASNRRAEPSASLSRS